MCRPRNESGYVRALAWRSGHGERNPFRLPDARIETGITHKPLRLAEAVDVADRCDNGERHDHVDTGDPIGRATFSSARTESENAVLRDKTRASGVRSTV